jgi:peptidyl-prolyl cis-trans isomerase B (cyclophilin B)
VSLDEQLPQFPGQPGQPGYPAAPPQPQRTSGLAITGFIFAFVFAPVGFILSLIAVFKTGAGKAKGRGLAIAGIIISVIIIGVVVAVAVAVSKSTVADPACAPAKTAVLDGSSNVTAASVKTTIDGLNAAAAKAKNADVRSATKALADDYTQLQTGMSTGNMPAGLQDKLTADAAKFDSLCTIGK